MRFDNNGLRNLPLLFRESKWWSFFCAEKTDYFLSGTYDRDNHACPLYPFLYACVRF